MQDWRTEYERHFLVGEFVAGREYEARLSKTMLPLIRAADLQAVAEQFAPHCSCIVQATSNAKYALSLPVWRLAGCLRLQRITSDQAALSSHRMKLSAEHPVLAMPCTADKTEQGPDFQPTAQPFPKTKLAGSWAAAQPSNACALAQPCQAGAVQDSQQSSPAGGGGAGG